MKRLARFLIRLYPANWRERYGEEFDALLEDSPLTPPGFFDLVKGAIKMQLSAPSFPKLALLLSITGLLAGLGVSFLVSPRYISTATLLLELSPGSPPADLRPFAAEIQQVVLSRTSLSRIIHDPRLNLYPERRAKMPLEDVIDNMRRDIQIHVVGPGATVEMSFIYRDPYKAHDTVQTLVIRFEETNLVRQRVAANMQRARSNNQIERMEARIAALEKRLGMPPSAPEILDQFNRVPGGINADVLDPPTLPASPAKPNRYVFMLFGFGAGFVAALMIAVFRRRYQPAIAGTIAIVAAAGFLDLPRMQAQAPQARSEFEVASIKPNAGRGNNVRIAVAPGGRMIAENVPVKILIRFAYDVHGFQISGGPAWINSDGYDISAKAEPNTRLPQMRPYLQTLLEDRFKLMVHRETKELPIYNLSPARTGLKIGASKPGGCVTPDPANRPRPGEPPPAFCGNLRMGRGVIEGYAIGIPLLLNSLSDVLGRTVIDKTGLTEKFDVNLKFTPDESIVDSIVGGPAGQPGSGDPGPPPPDGPSIFTALEEQLGLRLQSAKGPVEVVVIDHVDRPDGN